MNKQQLKKAYEEKLITEEQFKEELFKIETTKKEARKNVKIQKAFTEEEFGKLLEVVGNKNKKIIEQTKGVKETIVAFILGWEAGLRLGEVTHIMPEDVKDNTLEIRFKENWHPKFCKERIVSKPKNWKSWMTSVLPIKKSERSLERNLKSAIKKAGLDERFNFHSLRRGFATHFLKQGGKLEYVQILLGHSNISTTNSYIKTNPQDAIKSYGERF